MRSPLFNRRLLAFYCLPLVTGGVALYIVLWMMCERVGYRYELEWIEGGMLQQVVRITEGSAPYARPDMDYVPALYAPLYFYISAFFTTFLGKGLPAMRAVSVLASLITGCAIAASVWRLTQSRLAALLGVFCYSATYVFTACWFDVARVDSLWTMFLALTVASLVFYQSRNNIFPLYLAASCFTLSVLTKQTSLFLSPFLFLVLWTWGSLRSAIFFAFFVAASVGISGGIFQWISGGWFYFFTMEMAPHHGMNYSMWKSFLLGDTVGSVLFIALFSLFFIKAASPVGRVRLGWGLLLCGFASMTLVSRMYPGGVENVLMPYYMLLSIMGVGYFAIAVEQHCRSRPYVTAFIAILLSLNFYHGWVSQAAEYRVPNRKAGGDDAVGDALVQKIARVPGRVCVTMHGYLAYMAGKSFCSHRLLVQDILMGGDAPMVEALKADARNKIMSGYYQVIIIDTPVEIQDLGLKMKDIPYTMTRLDSDSAYPVYEFFPIVSGTKPQFWLEYNGSGFIDRT